MNINIKDNHLIHVEKGTSKYLIEYILLYHYGYMYYNFGDNHKDTKYNTNDISDGSFYFRLYSRTNGKKFMENNNNPIYSTNGEKCTVMGSSKFLRNYKMKKNYKSD